MFIATNIEREVHTFKQSYIWLFCIIKELLNNLHDCTHLTLSKSLNLLHRLFCTNSSLWDNVSLWFIKQHKVLINGFICQLCSSIPFFPPELRPVDAFKEIVTSGWVPIFVYPTGQIVHFQLESTNHEYFNRIKRMCIMTWSLWIMASRKKNA